MATSSSALLVQGLAAGSHFRTGEGGGSSRSSLRSSFAGEAVRLHSGLRGWRSCGSGGAAAIAPPRAVMDRVAPRNQPNFYELLGLPQDVALPDIKVAYRQMAKKLHPDVCPPEASKECAVKFIEVQEAYETLSDPRRRALYDMDMANSLNAIASGRRRYSDPDGCTEEWRVHWEDQLSNLKRRSAAKNADAAPESWGAKMRRKRQEQQQWA